MESCVVSELEGTLVKDPDAFSYFMLVAFEASGLVRFLVLLILWPVIRLLDMYGMRDAGLRLSVFVAFVGVHESEIESVARAVLPKFYMDDLDLEAWNIFSSYQKRIVVTTTPRVMVERFLKEHLRADEIIGSELILNRFGFATGFIKNEGGSIADRVRMMFEEHQQQKPEMGLGRIPSGSSFLSSCRVNMKTLILN